MELRPDVVAGKYNPLDFDPTGERLRINEIFYSIQGEGHHAGTACVFVRLSKCNLKCSFCDTEFETGQLMHIDDIVARVVTMIPGGADRECLQVSLTGGEPMLQNCGPLVQQLTSEGFYISIETSGSVWSEWARWLHWITISPKVRFADIPDALKLAACEYKWIVNAAFLTQFQKDWTSCWAPSNPSNATVQHALGLPHNFLQPEWGPNREKYTTAAVKLIQQYPNIYRLSLQQHKLIGVP